MIDGVQFEVNGIKKHSSDFDLEFVSYDLKFPEPKMAYVDIDGANGKLDLSETFGKIFYKNRKIILNFNSKKGFNETIRELATFLHGKVAKITLFDDAYHYYKGRVIFDKYSSDHKYGKVILSCDCEPYKLKHDLTVKRNRIVGSDTIFYRNERMETVPKFKADSPIRFDFNGSSYSINTTETIFPDIEFKNGNNIIKWIGNANVEVTYQEGTL